MASGWPTWNLSVRSPSTFDLVKIERDLPTCQETISTKYHSIHSIDCRSSHGPEDGTNSYPSIRRRMEITLQKFPDVIVLEAFTSWENPVFHDAHVEIYCHSFKSSPQMLFRLAWSLPSRNAHVSEIRDRPSVRIKRDVQCTTRTSERYVYQDVRRVLRVPRNRDSRLCTERSATLHAPGIRRILCSVCQHRESLVFLTSNLQRSFLCHTFRDSRETNRSRLRMVRLSVRMLKVCSWDWKLVSHLECRWLIFYLNWFRWF